ncbi:MAG: type II secretion system protein [Rickettsiales bacterium]
MNSRKKIYRGFSLVEMAIVISVMAVMMTTFFAIATELNINITQKNNESQMDAIEEAINKYYLTNGYLPCPAARNAAINNAAFGESTDCTASAVAGETVEVGSGANIIRIGVIPSRALGLADSNALDAYGNKIGYVIIKNLGVSAADFSSSTASSTAISIVDRAANSITSNLVGTDFISYIVMSFGINGHGAYNNQGVQNVACGSNIDAENCNDDNVFLETLLDPINDDDSLRWQTYNQLQYNRNFEFNSFTRTSPSPRRLFDKYAMITYEFGSNLPSGVASATQTYASANSWVSRGWNVVRSNTITSLTLGSNVNPAPGYYAGAPTQITLGAGTYWIKASAAAIQNGYNKLRLNAGGTILEYGAIDSSTPCNLNSTASSVYSAFPFLITVVTFSSPTTITLDQVFSTTTCATVNYLGQDTTSGGGTHSVIEIWQL